MQKSQYDIIIIGAGIVGCMTARFLSKYYLDILLIDKESDVGMGASGANSAIIHSGHDPKPGTLKARMNVLGNKMWKNIVAELDIPYKDTGSYVVAIGEDEFDILDELYLNGINNGVPGMKIFRRDEFINKEPLINPKVSGALWTPTACVIDPFSATLASAENAVNNGVELSLETKFLDFIIEDETIIGIKTNRGDISCRWVVNSAGVYSDEVMHKAKIRPEFKITPRRGEYLVFDASRVIINNVLFSVPSKKSKGTLVSTTVHGNVMIGPNAVVIDNKEDTSTTGKGLSDVLKSAVKLTPFLSAKDIIGQYAGIRATGNADKDFVIEIPSEIRGMVNLGGIESPGFASAPAIAQRVVDLLAEAGLALKEKHGWYPIRKALPVFRKLSHKERGVLVEKHPAYGRVVCRCEDVTEGEIVNAIHSAVPAMTYDAVKRRTWLGTGRCQGGFDYPRVIEILSLELNIPVVEVTKRGNGSKFLFRRTKVLE